jgi:hypothetical protein
MFISALIVLVVALGITAGIAVYKHGSLSAAKASAAKEAVLLEASASKLEASVKADILAIAARLKSL